MIDILNLALGIVFGAAGYSVDVTSESTPSQKGYQAGKEIRNTMDRQMVESKKKYAAQLKTVTDEQLEEIKKKNDNKYLNQVINEEVRRRKS